MLTSAVIFLVITWLDVISTENGVCRVDGSCFVNCEGSYNREIEKNQLCKYKISVMKLGLSRIKLDDLKHFQYYDIEYLHLNSKRLDDIENVSRYINRMNVSKLNLENNYFTKLKKLCFRNEFTFKLLSLNNNLIKQIETESIPKAKEIYLNNNFIENIVSNMFVDITLIEVLYLENNCLKTLTGNSLTGLTATKLSLSYNEISKLEANSIPMAQQVLFSKNRLKSLDANIFVNISSIRVLNLSSNNISNISESTFKGGCFSLLVLDTNNITEITRKTFSGLDFAMDLSLSNNRISLLEDDSIPRVLHLNLKYNTLNGFTVDVFRHPQYLQTIELTFEDTFDIPLLDNVTVLNSGVMVKHFGMLYYVVRKSTIYAIGGVILIALVAIVIGKVAKKQCSSERRSVFMLFWKITQERSRMAQQNSIGLVKEMGKEDVPEAYGFQVNEYEEIAIDHSRHYDYPSRDSKENEFYGLNINNNNNQL